MHCSDGYSGARLFVPVLVVTAVGRTPSRITVSGFIS